MSDSKRSPLAATHAANEIRAAAEAVTSKSAHAPADLLDTAWEIAKAHRQWTAGPSSAQSVAPGVEPANDWSWSELALGGMAAETPGDVVAPMRRLPRTDSGERWSLSRYAIVGQKAVYMMFEAQADSIERYVGCRIQILADGKAYELGEVNLDGVAQIRLEGPVDISQAVVRIGTRKQNT